MNKMFSNKHQTDPHSIKKTIPIIISVTIISKTHKLTVNHKDTPNPKNHLQPLKDPKKKPNLS
jgi:hypothetical protein